jgi:hypothetical protein
MVWRCPTLQHVLAVPAAAAGSITSLAWLPLTGAPVSEKQPHWLAVGSGSMVQCYAVSGRQAAAVATIALPAGCSSIKSLHGLRSRSTGSAPEGCLLLAVCSSSIGRGSKLASWRCSLGNPASRGIVLQLAASCSIPGLMAGVASVHFASDAGLVVRTTSGTVLLYAATADADGVTLQLLTALDGVAGAGPVAADGDLLHLATSCTNELHIWMVGDPQPGEASCDRDTCHQAARLVLPSAAGHVSALAWLQHTISPCLAVGTSLGNVLLAAASRDTNSWQWVAAMPDASASHAVDHLTASPSGGIVAATGSQLVRLADTVQFQQTGEAVQLSR